MQVLQARRAKPALRVRRAQPDLRVRWGRKDRLDQKDRPAHPALSHRSCELCGLIVTRRLAPPSAATMKSFSSPTAAREELPLSFPAKDPLPVARVRARATHLSRCAPEALRRTVDSERPYSARASFLRGTKPLAGRWCSRRASGRYNARLDPSRLARSPAGVF
jgi:hypothetical protein